MKRVTLRPVLRHSVAPVTTDSRGLIARPASLGAIFALDTFCPAPLVTGQPGSPGFLPIFDSTSRASDLRTTATCQFPNVQNLTEASIVAEGSC